MTPDRLRRLRAVAEAAFHRDQLALGAVMRARREVSARREALSSDAAREAAIVESAPAMAAVLTSYMKGVGQRDAALGAEDAALAAEEARRRAAAAVSFRKSEAVRRFELQAQTKRRRRRAIKEETETATLAALRRMKRL
ncbi:MAG: hypothetical protein AAFN79_21930 [Pseudomonadota bacterium]